MSILFTFLSYPDVSIATNMYTSLVHEVAALDNEVRVLAPTFNSNTSIQDEGGIPVFRVKSGPLFNTNIIQKGINNILLNARYKKSFYQYWRDWNPDWIVASTPPFTLAPFFYRIKKKGKLFLILRDIFPQNAKDLGLIKNSLLFNYFRYKERYLYRISDIIGCMSPGNISYLKNADPDIISTKFVTDFPNWISLTPIKDKNKDQLSFRDRFNLQNKFIALFGGNFGVPQKIEIILELAKRVQHLSDVVFCLVGNGTEKARITKSVQDWNLKNVLLFDSMPQEEYQSAIQDADIGLVTLSDKFTIPNIPSRTLGYWDASLPVLAATDTRTDLNESFLEKYKGGLWCPSNDIISFTDQFLKLYHDPNLRREFGVNGRKAVEDHFTTQTAAKRLVEQMHMFLKRQ